MTLFACRDCFDIGRGSNFDRWKSMINTRLSSWFQRTFSCRGSLWMIPRWRISLVDRWEERARRWIKFVSDADRLLYPLARCLTRYRWTSNDWVETLQPYRWFGSTRMLFTWISQSANSVQIGDIEAIAGLHGLTSHLVTLQGNLRGKLHTPLVLLDLARHSANKIPIG